MNARGAAAVVAGLVLLVGLLLGFSPHHVSAGSAVGPITCGSAFSPDGTYSSALDQVGDEDGHPHAFGQQCSDALSTPRMAAFGLIGVSALTLLFLGLTIKSATSRAREVEAGVV